MPLDTNSIEREQKHPDLPHSSPAPPLLLKEVLCMLLNLSHLNPTTSKITQLLSQGAWYILVLHKYTVYE